MADYSARDGVAVCRLRQALVLLQEGGDVYAIEARRARHLWERHAISTTCERFSKHNQMLHDRQKGTTCLLVS